jgi:hypothetical protein
MKNNIEGLRDMMFETMERLLHPASAEEGEEMDIEKAKAMANLGKVVVDSAKVEVQYLAQANKANRIDGETLAGTGFINDNTKQLSK